MHKIPTVVTSILLLAAAGSIPGYADTYTFDFNSLGSGATAAQITAYMNAYFTAHGCNTCSVVVTGAVADKTYDGDGNVVGPNGHPLTLGTSDGATSNSSLTPTGNLNSSNQLTSGTADTFIANTSDGAHQVANEFYLTFSGLQISGVSFDYEIFPDGTANQPPDFEFEAGNHTNGTDTAVASFGTNGTQFGVSPGASGANGSSAASPASQHESSGQYINTFSGSLGNVTELDFIDWPATIGIDNLKVTTTVPEPGSILLLLTAAAGAAFGRKKLRKA